MSRPTLIRPPRIDESKSPIENILTLTPIPDVGPDLFTNTREHWTAPGARGIYGGIVIAQSLAAAFYTVPDQAAVNGLLFLPHSMHCYFLLAGDSAIPIIYHVERVRNGRSFVTRTVQARQRGKCIFTTTISFVAEQSHGEPHLEHGWDLPSDAIAKLRSILHDKEEHQAKSEDMTDAKGQENSNQDIVNVWPFTAKPLGIDNNSSIYPHKRRPQSWLQCNGNIKGGIQDHICALAYMSDSYFIGALPRIHRASRFASNSNSSNPYLRSLAQWEIAENDSNGGATRGQDLDGRGSPNTLVEQPRGQIGMMVSLDHTIYFHRPNEVKADDWVFTEMEVPWSGEGRGLVTQRMWSQSGRLLASCVQEGLVRLQAENAEAKSKL